MILVCPLQVRKEITDNDFKSEQSNKKDGGLEEFDFCTAGTFLEYLGLLPITIHLLT